MKKTVKSGISLFVTFCLVAVIFVGAFPVRTEATPGEKEYPNLKIKTVDISPTTPAVGNPFEATFHFVHDTALLDTDKNGNSGIDHISISVSSVNGSIRIGEKNYTILSKDIEPYEYQVGTGEDVSTNQRGIKYDLFIPEKELKYLGPTSGTLRFTINYYSDEKGKDLHSRYVLQKTIAFAKSDEENSVIVDEDSTMPEVKAGSTAQINIPLISNGIVGVKQVTVKLPTDSKISLASSGNIFSLSFEDKQKVNLPLLLKVKDSLAPGIYPLTLVIDGKEITAYVQVLDADGGVGKLAILEYKLDRSTVNEGQKFNMSVVVKNNSSSSYSNVTVTLDGLSNETVATNGVLNTKSIPVLKEGETASVSFPLVSNPKMISGNYNITLKLSADNQEKEVSATAFIPIKGTKTTSEKSMTSKPQIIIESYDYGGLSVTGGNEFLLKMKFKNTSKTVAIQNLKMTVGNPPSTNANEDVAAFTPAKSSNTFFIENVGPSQTFGEEIALFPKVNAAPKSYGITITYTFEALVDGALESLKGEETISIPLAQPDRFEVTDAEIYGPVLMGEQGQLNINYVNKGKTLIYNLSVTMDGNFTSADMNTYIGNVESGAGDSFTTSLSPTEEGMLKGSAKFTYEDANGSKKEIVKQFSCEVSPAQPINPDPYPMEDPSMNDQEGLPQAAFWLILAGGSAFGIFLLVFLFKQLKARQQRILDESDNFEEDAELEDQKE